MSDFERGGPADVLAWALACIFALVAGYLFWEHYGVTIWRWWHGISYPVPLETLFQWQQ